MAAGSLSRLRPCLSRLRAFTSEGLTTNFRKLKTEGLSTIKQHIIVMMLCESAFAGFAGKPAQAIQTWKPYVPIHDELSADCVDEPLQAMLT